MKPKATNAKKKMAALRMPPYSARSVCAQFCCLLLALAIATLPFTGVRPRHTPMLAPLGAEPVPLDMGLQIPSSSPFRLPSLLNSGRLVLGVLPWSSLGPFLHNDGRSQLTSSG